jgi:hypothetical protein
MSKAARARTVWLPVQQIVVRFIASGTTLPTQVDRYVPEDERPYIVALHALYVMSTVRTTPYAVRPVRNAPARRASKHCFASELLPDLS